MTIAGLPLHPLVVHAAVVLVPLAAIGAAVHVLVPRWRWVTRHPALAISALAAVSVQVAAMTGDSLKESETSVSALVAKHELWAGRLQASMWVLAAVVAVAWWVLPHSSPLPDADRGSSRPRLAQAVTYAVPALAVITLVLVVMTGDAGARAVWAAGR